MVNWKIINITVLFLRKVRNGIVGGLNAVITEILLSIEQYLKNDEFTFLQTREKKTLLIVSMDIVTFSLGFFLILMKYQALVVRESSKCYVLVCSKTVNTF